MPVRGIRANGGREWMPTETWNKNMNYGDVNYCVLRYADVVLMAAEAYNETGNTTEAWNLLNRVRARAGATISFRPVKERRKKSF